MKKNVLTHYSLFVLLALALVMSSCSSDDNDNSNPSNGSASATLAGTYKGRLDTWSVETGTMNYFDVILTVTDLTNGKVRVSADKGNGTPKDIAVSWNSEKYIVGSDTQGSITYVVASKIIGISTKQTAESEIEMVFEGTKQ